MSQAPGAADDRAAYAGFWRRFAAYAIDYLLVLLGGIVLGAVVLRAGIVEDGTQGRFTLWLLVGYFLYCVLLESSPWQATVGKRLIGIKVVDRHGNRIGFARAAAVVAAISAIASVPFLGVLAAIVLSAYQDLGAR